MSLLATIELSDNLRLRDFKNRPLRAGSTRYLLDGGYVNQSMSISGGQLFLDGYRDGNSLHGYFTGAQVDAIRLLYGSGAEVDFIHHLGGWRVRVVDVDFTQISRRAAPGGTERYVGTVTLLII